MYIMYMYMYIIKKKVRDCGRRIRVFKNQHHCSPKCVV